MKVKQGHCRVCGYLILKLKELGADSALNREGSNELDQALSDDNFQERLGRDVHHGPYCRCKEVK